MGALKLSRVFETVTHQWPSCTKLANRTYLYFILSESQIPTDNLTPSALTHYFEFSEVQYSHTPQCLCDDITVIVFTFHILFSSFYIHTNFWYNIHTYVSVKYYLYTSHIDLTNQTRQCDVNVRFTEIAENSIRLENKIRYHYVMFSMSRQVLLYYTNTSKWVLSIIV